MKFLIALTIANFVLLGASAVDSEAEAKCRSLHHVDVDPGTSYSNSQCVLRCVVHGKVLTHNMNEGLACPTASSGVSVVRF